MQRGKLGAAVVALLIGFGLVGADVAQAQRFNPRARPLFGAARLRSGFMPDPHVLNGRMGGPIQASQVNSGCRGYISQQPSHVVISRTGFRQIRFIVSAQSDTTLVVMLPNGQILCDDDGGEGLNALIQTTAPRGRIAIWVGAYSQSATGHPYTLGVSELGHITASNLNNPGQPNPGRPPSSALASNAPPMFGAANLRSGFMPDPHIMSGTAGGSIRGSTISSGCRGYYNPRPSHVLDSRTGFRNIRFVVNSGLDTTLLVMLPDGRIVCDDDGGNGLNPLVSTNAPRGPIRVWVGSYSQGRSGPYNIGFSELGNVSTGNIPSPGGGGGTVVANPPPTTPEDIVQMTVSIPVTLMGPGMSGNTVAVWSPSGGSPVRFRLNGRSLMAGSTSLGEVPGSMTDPVVTVEQRRNGTVVVRAEQPPAGRGDRGQQFLMLVRWQGRPTVANRWSGTARQRGPRWSR